MLDLTPYTKDKAIRRRFLSKIQFCDHGKACDKCCWLWKEPLTKSGYGQFFVCTLTIEGEITSRQNRKKELNARPQRFMYTLRYGHTDLFTLHTCDNAACVNYNHLYAGTQKENIRDIQDRNRGTFYRGEKHPNAKLTEEDIYHIFYLYGQGYKQTVIANMLSVNQKTINDIVNGKRWNWLTNIRKG